MKENVKNINLKAIKPYGDTLDDGKIQFSFTLPVKDSPEAKESAKLYLQKLGLSNIMIVHHEPIGKGFTFIIAYASSNITIDFTKIHVAKATNESWDKKTIVKFIENHFNKITIIGACIESDAHTVGIDAILNMKGIAGHKGLESYHGFEVFNLGAQVPCESLIKKAKEVNADAILVSQIVTQKNIHIKNLTKLVELLEAENYRDKVVLIVGGPRIEHKLAIELGYDAGFGPHTFPEDVATFIVKHLAKKKGIM